MMLPPDQQLTGRQLTVRILSTVVLAALTVVGLSQLSIDTGVDSFVPTDDATLRATHQVAESFGGDPIVVLLESQEPRALLSQEVLPALLQLEGDLARSDHVSAVYGPGTVLNQIAGQAQDLLAELVGARDGVQAAAEKEATRSGASKTEATAAGERATREFDQRYLPMLEQGMPTGLPTLHNATFVTGVVFNADGQPRPQWDFVVPTERAVAILVRPDAGLRQSSTEALVRKVRQTVADAGLGAGTRVTVAGIPTVIADLGDQIRHDVLLLGGLAIVGVGAWFWLVPWTSRRRRWLPLGVTVAGSAVTLAGAGWLGVPMSLGVVAFLPVLLGVGSDFMVYLVSRVGPRLVLTAAAASAAGFAALGLTPISAARQLGWVLATGVLVTAALSVVISRWLGPEQTAPAAVRRPAPGRPAIRAMSAVAAVVIAATGWWSLSGLRLDADLTSIAQSIPAYRDVDHVEDVMGSSGEIAVVLSGRDTASVAALQWMRKTETAIVTEYGDEVQPILSPPQLLTFLGGEPTDDQMASALRLLPPYLRSSVIRSDSAMSVMSFSVRVTDAQELKQVRDELRDVMPPPPAGTSVDLVGLPMVAVSSYESLAADRYLNAGLGIAAAGVVLLVLSRRRRDATLAVMAAALTTGFVLLGMRLLDIGLNPLTAAVGSLAAAVACEFTVVLADAVRRGRRDQPVLLAAAACATGYGVLALSRISVVSDFGLLLAVTVLVAAATAHLVVWWSPALGGER